MPRPALTDDQRRLIRRNIREAAAQLYAEKGINNISVRAVAQLAGVSVGTVYSHFGSLSELMQSLWRRPARKLVQSMMQLAEKESDPVERLRQLFKAYARFSEEEPQVFRSAFMYVRPSHIDPPEQVGLESDQFFNLFKTAIVLGQEQDQIRPGDPDVLVQLTLGAIHGALALPINLHRLALRDGPGMVDEAIAAQLEWLTT